MQERMTGKGKYRGLKRSIWRGQICQRFILLRVPHQMIAQLCASGERCPQKPNHLFNTLDVGLWITGGVTQSDQKSEMTQNAVADLAEPRKVNEQALLEERRQRIV